MSQAFKIGKGPGLALGALPDMADSIRICRRRALAPQRFARAAAPRHLERGCASAWRRNCLLLAGGLALPAGIALAAAPLAGGYAWWRYPLAALLYLTGTAVVASGFFRARN